VTDATAPRDDLAAFLDTGLLTTQVPRLLPAFERGGENEIDGFSAELERSPHTLGYVA
jgi:hypothetical protein